MKKEYRSNSPSPRQATRILSGSLVFARDCPSSRGDRPSCEAAKGSIMSIAGDCTIITERLRLRPYAITDFDSMSHLMSRPQTVRYPPRDPLARDEVWARLLGHIGHWATFGYGFCAVEERATGAFIGEAGLALFRRGLAAAFDDAPEATWTIAPAYQGLGYATEAARAAQHWIERRLGAPRTLCMIHPDNAPSLTIARKLGYREIDRVIYKGHPAIFFQRRLAAAESGNE